MIRILLLASVLGWLCPAVSAASTVYAIVCADTSSVRNTSGGDVAYSYHNEFDMEPMSAGVFTTIMTEEYRQQYRDSSGNPIVFTWYMLTGGWHHYATNVDAVAATRVFQEEWGEINETLGDELALHFHHFSWDGDDWGMAPSFASTLWDFEWSMSQLVIDNGVLPVSFRSGWNYMDNAYQRELERWIPFRKEAGGWINQAIPYHPSFDNYRVPGDMRGWEVRHHYLAGLSASTINQTFGWAAAGQDQVICLWSHQYESTFLNQIHNAHELLTDADDNYLEVDFRYVTGRDGMRMWQGSDDRTPPALDFEIDGFGMTITSEPDIFQLEQPYIAARLSNDQYVRLDAFPEGAAAWRMESLPGNIDHLDIAVCDLMGNATIEEWLDGSKRWSSQTEFRRGTGEGVSALDAPSDLRLKRDAFIPVLEQTQTDGTSAAIERSYWIGQTFVPTQPGLSAVEVGVLASGQSTLRVEVRTVNEQGFPNEGSTDLLGSGSASVSQTGWVTVPLDVTGLQTDGTPYTLVFKRTSGTGNLEIRMDTEGQYGGGNLTRAFSLDWIHIPDFDCQFRTLDQTGAVDQFQETGTASTYNLEQAYLLARTFTATSERIDRIEVEAVQASASEQIQIQLRTTLADGTPNMNSTGLINARAFAVDGPGMIDMPVGWALAPEHRGEELALVFVPPQSGKSSIQLATYSEEPVDGGALYEITDSGISPIADDLKLRLLAGAYQPSGTIAFDFDSGDSATEWLGGKWEAELATGTGIRARLAVAGKESDLETPHWGAWYSTTPFAFDPPPEGRWARIEVELSSNQIDQTPIMDAVELIYTNGTAPRKGDIDRNGHITPADAQAAFECYVMAECRDELYPLAGDVRPATPDRILTPADAQALFDCYLADSAWCD